MGEDVGAEVGEEDVGAEVGEDVGGSGGGVEDCDLEYIKYTVIAIPSTIKILVGVLSSTI